MVGFIGPAVHIQECVPERKKTILVVDDNADILELHKTLLEIGEYEVFTAQSGSEAFSVLAQIDAPDLILLDLLMEDMSGPEFLLLLEEKRPEIIDSVPVVLLTAMDEVPSSKAMGFIQKPTQMNEFLAAVHRYIEAGTGHRPLKH
jgi:CheY-like chemotaxis protein